MIENIILLLGVPDAMTSPYEANFAQSPQGPILRDGVFAPKLLRERIDRIFRYFFNPSIRMTNVGMHIIGHNLQKDLTDGRVEVIDYPDEDEVLRKVAETWYAVIGISIGAEPLVLRAKEFAMKIREASQNPEVSIVFGNYGAISGKNAGILDGKDGEVLWTPPKQRTNDDSAYLGEGVHDMRLYLQRLGILLNPKGLIESPVFPDKTSNESPGLAARQLGLNTNNRRGGILAVAMGCPNRCYFCNTSVLFGGRKLELHSGADSIFQEICQFDDKTGNDENIMPGLTITIMDENFTKPMDTLIELCRKIKESGRNIRLSIFGDIGGLHKYLNEHGSFIELARGGLSNVWLGIESKIDFFKKRGGASPEDVQRIVEELQRLGIVVIGSFIVGLPIHAEYETNKKTMNIHDDFRWSRELGTAGYQVMTESLTHVVNTDKAEPLGGKSSQEKWGHVRTNTKNPHPHIPNDRLGKLDVQFREMVYFENGPMSVRAIMTIWEGYKNLRESKDPSDLRIASYCYWVSRHSSHLLSLAMAFATLPIFKEFSGKFTGKVAGFFDEVGNMPPPAYNDRGDQERAYSKYTEEINPLVKLISDRLRKRFAGKFNNNKPF